MCHTAVLTHLSGLSQSTQNMIHSLLSTVLAADLNEHAGASGPISTRLVKPRLHEWWSERQLCGLHACRTCG